MDVGFSLRFCGRIRFGFYLLLEKQDSEWVVNLLLEKQDSGWVVNLLLEKQVSGNSLKGAG